MRPLPLDGIRVLDLSHSWAGPHVGRLLADYGAEVIKVEYPRRLCLLRGARKAGKAYNSHPAWFQVNRNKYGITLDLTHERERKVFEDLVTITDVVIDNSRVGVSQKLGFDYETLRMLRHNIIVLSMTAFGSTGPFASYAGYGAVMEGVGGIQSRTAYEPGERPVRMKEVDVVNGVAGAGAILTALLYRQRTGQGQFIDLSQMEATAHATVGEHFLQLAANGKADPSRGNRHPSFAPQGCYPCKGEDRWVAITIRSDAEWRIFATVIGHPEWLQDDRLETAEGRRLHFELLEELISQWTRQHTNHEIMEHLQRKGLCAGVVLDTAELASDHHLTVRRYFKSAVNGTGERFMGVPCQFPDADVKVRWRGPDVGAHNDSVVRGLLGRPAEDVPVVRDEEICTAFEP